MTANISANSCVSWIWGWKTVCGSRWDFCPAVSAQALTLLMATIAKPKLLLLDEHTAALDPGAAEKILAMTTRIAAEQN